MSAETAAGHCVSADVSALEQRGAESVLPGDDRDRGGVDGTRKRRTRQADMEREGGGGTEMVRLHSFQEQ